MTTTTLPSPLGAAVASSDRVLAGRIAAIDWMRGLVMVLMVVDHASQAFNRGRVANDSWATHALGTELPPLQFITRWITHLCAPTFVFLAGTSLALSVARRRARGDGERSIDAAIVGRGSLLVALDLVWFTPLWLAAGVATTPVLQVLYAIGAGLVLMAGLRRLPTPALVAIGLALVVFVERWSVPALESGTRLGASALLVAPGFAVGPGAGPLDSLLVVYPLLPWLGVMVLGHAFGRTLVRRPATRDTAFEQTPEYRLTLWGIAGVAVFAVFRDINGYGNMLLRREGASLVDWLHVSKYPPSLTFLALELGLMALLLAAMLRWERSSPAPPRADGPLLVFGQTALLFYLLHVPVLELAAHALGMSRARGLPEAFLASVAVLPVLYAACRRFRAYRAAHPESWARLL